MKLKNLKLKNLIIFLIITLIYPIYKCITSDNKLLVLSDSLTIISLILIFIGTFNWLYLKGDFNNIAYIARRSFLKLNDYTYMDYHNNLQELKKDRFNYPLFVGLIFLLISIILNIIY